MGAPQAQNPRPHIPELWGHVRRSTCRAQKRGVRSGALPVCPFTSTSTCTLGRPHPLGLLRNSRLTSCQHLVRLGQVVCGGGGSSEIA